MTNPLVSVVIPVRNEAPFIAATLESILNQDYPGPVEVIIADGMSDDGTRQFLDEIGAADARVRYVDNPSGRTPTGLNLAIEESRGDVIVRCDGHAELPPDYISNALETLEKTGAVNVGGVQRAVGETWMQRAIAYAMSSPIGVGDSRFHYGGTAGPADTAYLGVFRRDALLAAGMFDEDLVRNQDYELNIRLRNNGGAVWFDPRLDVVYRPRRSLKALWSQYSQYGTWKRRVIRMHPESTRLRQLAAPAFLIALALSAGLAFTPWWGLALITPGAYLAVLIAAMLLQLIRTKDSAALGFPLAVATMHFAWGLGFFFGHE